jgi:eukaryotic-like serine/threonine-protein kinase
MPDSKVSSPLLRTLLASDLVDSTRLLERLGDQRAAELFARHDRGARDLMEVHRAREIDRTDGFLLAFDRPISAVEYALAYHDHLARLGVEMDVPL